MGVGWEEDKRCVTYGLEPFVFDPGPQTSQEELARDAEKRVRSDKRFREVLSKEKAAITAVLQGCLEKVNGQLERGEEVCQKAHFPLLNPRDFEDMESFARHDHFTVDLRIDKVDESLQKLVSSLLGIVWTNIQVENETKAKSLERFSQALQERMETLEYHLNDRSRQLSNCRYAYFLEITHLRNQLYIKNQSDDENFEPVEAYFFDPTEYLEEELRQQLNDKITLSVKVYKEKLNAKCREVADLELQLETLQALNAQRNDDNLENYLQIACNKHGAKNVVETLAQLAEKEMHQWAQNVRGGKTPQANAEGLEGSFSPARLEQMRQAMMQAAQEAEEERALRRQAEEALREAQKELEELTRALEEQKLNDAGQAVPKAAAPLVQARSLVDPSEMDELRKELARIKLQLEKERSKSAELQLLQETKASETRAKLEDYDDTHAVLKEAQEVHKTAESAGPTETLSACAEQVVTALKERSEELESLRSFSKSKSALALSEPASRQDSKSRMSSRQTTREFTKAEEHQEVEQSDGEERGPGEGCQHDEAQTRITASGNCFYLLEALETAEEEAIKAQLEELQECMDSAWDAALGAIRGSLKPPKGTGTNRSSRGAFLRLFHGVRSRLTRYELLVEQINSMRRAELEQVLEGTHFLMESSLPDEDVGLRDSIFGKGITKVMLEETRHPLDFAALVKRWSGHCGRIVGHLVRSRASIFLEAHPGRRIFIPLPGTVPSHDGGTGGGLQARQRKDFSPTRQKLYDGLSDYEAHSPCSTMRGRRCSPSRSPVRVPRCLSPPRSARSARSESRARSPSGDGIAVEGRALQSFAADGSPISLARFIRHASGCGLDWERCVSAPEGLQPTEGVEGDSLLRNRSPDSGELSEAEKEAARARREARAGKMREEVLERLAAEADKWHALGVSGIPASRQEADLSGLPIGEPRPARPAEEPPKESEECAHPTAHDLPVPFGDVGLMAAARPRPKLQKEQRLPIFSQGQKGPAFQMPSVGQWQPLTHGAAATDRDRSLERERQRWCDISSGPLGPMPTWEYEEATESKRPLGGTYTTIKLRPGSAQASKVQDGGAQPAPPPKPRPVSAQDQLETPQMCSSSSAVSVGRLRPGVGIARSQSSGALQGPLSVYGYKKSKGLPPPRRPTSSPSLR